MAAARVPTVAEEPGGLVYVPAFVTEDEERTLVAAFDNGGFEEVRMRGQVALRTVHHFGHRYDYEGWRLVPAHPLPDAVAWLRDRAGALADVDPTEFAETLVTRYPPGAGIGWHRDAPLFGPKVVGVSLLAPCRMRFQRRAADVRRVHELPLAPRSAYVLAGAARWSWQHSIPAVAALRYSITFRTVVRTGRPDAASSPPRLGTVNCPVDNEILQMTERSGVEVDYCPRCRGVWLDRGELDKILERAEREMPVAVTGRPGDDYDREDDRRRDDDYERRDIRDSRDSYGRPHKKKKKSFLSEMFEFGDD